MGGSVSEARRGEKVVGLRLRDLNRRAGGKVFFFSLRCFAHAHSQGD